MSLTEGPQSDETLNAVEGPARAPVDTSRSLVDLAGNRLDFTVNRIPASLCGSCCNGHVIRRRGNMDSQHREVSVFCRRIERRVPPDVGECSGYCNSSEMHRDEMEKLVQERGLLINVDNRPHPGQFL